MNKNIFITSLRILVVLTILTGVIYPLFITVISKVIFPWQSEGSLMVDTNKIFGSSLIGQKFESVRYFWPRPSAIDYNPLPSGGTNLGPTSDSLKRVINERRQNIFSNFDLQSNERIPKDLLFSSGSGLDPHVSPEAAIIQINRVAKARGFSNKMKEKLSQLVKSFIEPPQFGVFGEPRVNVLLLNFALDKLDQ